MKTEKVKQFYESPGVGVYEMQVPVICLSEKQNIASDDDLEEKNSFNLIP